MTTVNKGKTLWDWLDLLAKLAIPVVVALATVGFGWWQAHLAEVQHQQDQQRALDQQQATILQTYIDNIQDLLLNHHLLEADGFDPSNLYYDVASLARARTLTALRGLDLERKGRLLAFLYEAKLIGYFDNTKHQTSHSIIDLSDADFSGADLYNVSPYILDLSGVVLSNAIFSGVYFLTQQQLDGVTTCKGTILPKGLICHYNQ